jgi:competence ComEA-like helix-hairpin-helix protein
MKHLIFATVLSLMTLNASAESVDLNTASAQEIAKSLNGIGLSKAKKIIEYRNRFGPIDTPEELLAIKGIGEKTLEKNRSKMITRVIWPRQLINPVGGLDEAPLNH